MEKTDFRKLPRTERYAYRKRAMHLIKEGEKKKEVARIFGVRATTISEWAKNYKELGLKGLKDNPRGVKSVDVKLLSKEQEIKIQKMIIDTMPNQLKLPYSLWTRKAVKESVEWELGVIMAINTMGDYLRLWGFSPQKPKEKAYEQCSKKAQKWLEEKYPAIQKKAKQENAKIHWGDETGVRNNSQHSLDSSGVVLMLSKEELQ